MKKRKLNSSNPRYKKTEEAAVETRKELITTVKGVKVYAVFYQ
jgi:hypothetical protein|tara:strand:+ start:205 stop:333 length:129 start_codon:yes stop_codon:yes gene_type:complete